MGKYSKDKKQPLVIQAVRIEQRAINEALEIHENLSEFIRDALDEKIIREQKTLKELGL